MIISLNDEIEKILLDAGAIKVGFVTRETMTGGPPSADITYPLKEAQSAIIFALPLDKDKIRPFLRKDLPNSRILHEGDNVRTYLNTYKVGLKAVKFLEGKGYKTKILVPNFRYRKKGVKGYYRIRSLPEVSLRYLAVRSGVGSFGWSGNIGVKGVGAPVILGGIVTEAKLEPTDPVPPEESFCNKCKLCAKVCPYRMFDDLEESSVTLGGHTFTYAKRHNIMRCYLSCGGYSGLDKTEKWSTWAPGRFPYQEDDKDVVHDLVYSYIVEGTPPKWNVEGEIKDFDVSEVEDDPDFKKIMHLKENKLTYKMVTEVKLTCGNCQLICWGDPKATAENFKMLTESGCVVRKKDGNITILPPEEAKAEFERLGGIKNPNIFKRFFIWVGTKYMHGMYEKHMKES